MEDTAENKNATTTEAAAPADNQAVQAVASAADAPIDENINGRPCQTVPLEVPIKRASGDITELKVLKPLGGDLRGLSFKSLVEMDAVSVQVLLPRIVQPLITQQEATNLDLVDQANCAGVIYDFLHPMALRKAMRQ